MNDQDLSIVGNKSDIHNMLKYVDTFSKSNQHPIKYTQDGMTDLYLLHLIHTYQKGSDCTIKHTTYTDDKQPYINTKTGVLKKIYSQMNPDKLKIADYSFKLEQNHSISFIVLDDNIKKYMNASDHFALNESEYKRFAEYIIHCKESDIIVIPVILIYVSKQVGGSRDDSPARSNKIFNKIKRLFFKTKKLQKYKNNVEIGLHANLLIYKKRLNTIEAYEPNLLYIPDDTSKIYSELHQYLQDHYQTQNIQFINMNNKIHTRFIQNLLNGRGQNDTIGLQELETINNQSPDNENAGYCETWSLFMCELSLMYPNLSARQIAESIIQKYGKHTNKYTYILKNFILHIYKILNKYFYRLFNSKYANTHEHPKYIITYPQLEFDGLIKFQRFNIFFDLYKYYILNPSKNYKEIEKDYHKFQNTRDIDDNYKSYIKEKLEGHYDVLDSETLSYYYDFLYREKMTAYEAFFTYMDELEMEKHKIWRDVDEKHTKHIHHPIDSNDTDVPDLQMSQDDKIGRNKNTRRTKIIKSIYYNEKSKTKRRNAQTNRKSPHPK